MSQTRSMGWAMDREDRPFLARFAAKFPAAFRAAPLLKNLSYPWLRVENQGRIGSCQGHGLSTACEVLHFVATGQQVQFSRLYAYLRTQQEDGLLGRDAGSTIAGGIKVATTVGLPLEELIPYSGDSYPSEDRRRWVLSPEHEQAATPFRVKAGVVIASFEDAMAWVSGGGAISIGTLYEHERGVDCIVRRWKPTGKGGHARCVCEIREGLLGDLGSWGKDYLDNGRQWWTPQAFNEMLRDPYSVVMGLSDMAKPAPRKIDFNDAVWKS